MQTASGNLRDGFPEESQVCRRECCHRQFRAALTATEQVVNTFSLLLFLPYFLPQEGEVAPVPDAQAQADRCRPKA